MTVYGPSDISVYDNRYSKPTQISAVPKDRHFSMAVFFKSNGVWYYGQHDFDTGMWETLPDDDRSRKIKDANVTHWFCPPETKDLFEEDTNLGR